MKNALIRILPVLALAGASAGFGAPAAQAPLRVTVSCSGMQCSAAAFGGSGTYVSWQWSLAEPLFEVGNASYADASPHCAPGYMLGVDAVVTDSNGNRALNGTWVFCP